MDAAGHSEHFLRRLDRVSDHQVELALTLYRDEELLRDVLARAELDSNHERVAISLADPLLGPFVVVTREGRFVTCLGEGMRVSDDVAVVSPERLRAAIAKVERMRERVAQVQALRDSGADGIAAQLFRRMRKDGLRFCREDVQTLIDVWPLVSREACGILGDAIVRLRAERKSIAYMRFDKLSPRDEERLLSFYDLSLACAHLLVLTDHDESVARVLAEMPGEVDPRLMWCLALFDLGSYAHMLRALWIAGRRARQLLPDIKALRDDPRRLSRIYREASLAIIALASPRLAAEARKAMWSTGTTLADATEPWTAELVDMSLAASRLAQVALDHTSTPMAEHTEHGRLMTARFVHRSMEVSDAQLAEVPDDVGNAWMANLFLTTLKPGDGDRIGAIFTAIPFVASASAADLYLPRRWTEHLVDARRLEAIEMFQHYGESHMMRRTTTAKRQEPKVGRNDPCACGSGKKSKRCCAQRIPS